MSNKLNGFFVQPKVSDAAVLLTGLMIPFGFAPYNLSYLLFPLLGIFGWFLLSQSNGRSFWRGWLFGFGQFVIGFSWIYHSVHTYGHAPAALAVAMIILLAAYCALFPGLAAYLAQRFFNKNINLFLLLGLPSMWALTEWLRGYLFTGFPWLSLGVSQVDTSLAFFAPVFGSLGTGIIMLLIAGMILISVLQPGRAKIFLPSVVSVFILGQLLAQINWSEPVSDPIKVSLAQLSIQQDQKWRAENRVPSMQWYLQQTKAHKDSDLIVWPETAIPSFIRRVAPFWEKVKKEAERSDTEVVAGVFIRDTETGRYYNSLLSSKGDFYQKKHLVPLGEYMPFRSLFEFVRKFVQFPMSDIANGPDDQPLMKVAGYPVGSSICFEDVFDRDIRSSLPEAKFLINVSNDAWFKKSAEPYQHHQIARARALEAARYMVRSTNTGVSAIIGPKGEEIVTSQLFEQVTVSGDIRAMSGETPYVFWGNVPVILIALGLLGWRGYSNRLEKSRSSG